MEKVQYISPWQATEFTHNTLRPEEKTGMLQMKFAILIKVSINLINSVSIGPGNYCFATEKATNHFLNQVINAYMRHQGTVNQTLIIDSTKIHVGRCIFLFVSFFFFSILRFSIHHTSREVSCRIAKSYHLNYLFCHNPVSLPTTRHSELKNDRGMVWFLWKFGGILCFRDMICINLLNFMQKMKRVTPSMFGILDIVVNLKPEHCRMNPFRLWFSNHILFPLHRSDIITMSICLVSFI